MPNQSINQSINLYRAIVQRRAIMPNSNTGTDVTVTDSTCTYQNHIKQQSALAALVTSAQCHQQPTPGNTGI